MKQLIIYKSRTGFTKQYSKWICEELHCEMVDYADVKRINLDEYDLVVYGSRIHAGIIDGLNKFRKMMEKKSAKIILFATGATPNAAVEEIQKIPQQNRIDDSTPFFYMQSGLCYEKMGVADRTLMKMMSKILESSKNRTEIEDGMKNAISASHDISSKEYIKELVNCVRSLESDS